MGISNRDYQKGTSDDEFYSSGGGGGGIGGRLSKHSIVTWLIGINALVFMLDSVLTGSVRGGGASLTYWGAFWFDSAINHLQIWRFITFQFLHAGFFHIFFNMLGLYFFGPMVEQWWGSKRFLAFYLISGTSAAMFYLLLGAIPGLIPGGNLYPLVGASGGLFGVLVAAAFIAPNQTVQLLFPPIPMKMKTMVFVFLAIAALNVLVGGNNAGGDAAHLGGALLGFLLMKSPGLLNFADHLSPTAIQAGYTQGRFEKKLKAEQDAEAELDRLLDKVSQKGLHSLSSREKKRLNQLSEQKRHEPGPH